MFFVPFVVTEALFSDSLDPFLSLFLIFDVIFRYEPGKVGALDIEVLRGPAAVAAGLL